MSEGAKGVESFHTQASKKDATWPSARVVATDNFRRVSESYYGISPVYGFSPGAYLGGKPSKSNPSRDCEAVPQSELDSSNVRRLEDVRRRFLSERCALSRRAPGQAANARRIR